MTWIIYLFINMFILSLLGDVSLKAVVFSSTVYIMLMLYEITEQLKISNRKRE